MISLLLIVSFLLIVSCYSIRRSAILMPYNFGNDDTGRYILLMIKVLQDLDERYHVDLLLCHGGSNHGHSYIRDGHRPCLEEKCVYETIHIAGIPVKGEQLRIKPLDLNTLPSSNKLPQPDEPYDIFISIGTEELPTFHGIGSIFNILVWQLHGDEIFDNYSSIEGTAGEALILCSYDWVFVNSRHNHARYSSIMLPLYGVSASLNMVPPTVSILSIPLDPVNEISKKNNEITNARDTSLIDKINSNIGPPLIGANYDGITTIVAIGKFSLDSKYGRPHAQYLKIYNEIIKATKKKINLVLAGHNPGGVSSKYIDRLRDEVKASKLNVTILLDDDHTKVIEQLSTADIIWHGAFSKEEFVGFKQPDATTASTTVGHRGYRHRGRGSQNVNSGTGYFDLLIAPLGEAMSAGAVAIVYNRGTACDIIDHGRNGFVANSLVDYAKSTVYLLNDASDQEIMMLRRESTQVMYSYNKEKFFSAFKTVIFRGLTSKHLRKYIKMYYPGIRNIPLNIKPFSNYTEGEEKSVGVKKVALIVEPGINTHFEYAVRNVMYYLGPDWSCQVQYSKDSKEFVKAALKDIKNVDYMQLNVDIRSVHDFNRLMKEALFWEPFRNHKVLIFQSDSFMLRPGMNSFLNFDYIGAPWHLIHNERVAKYVEKGYLKNGVGNGGFSLRTGAVMHSVAKSLGGKKSPNSEQEDMFFAHHLERLGYAVGDRKSAYLFAWEVYIDDLNKAISNKSPVAFHAAWYYFNPTKINPYLESGLLPKLNVSMGR